MSAVAPLVPLTVRGPTPRTSDVAMEILGLQNPKAESPVYSPPRPHPILDSANMAPSGIAPASQPTFFDKTTPEERTSIDRALVDRDPPTYQAVFEKFGLAAKGVSRSAFCNYARRVRVSAAQAHIAELVSPDPAEVSVLLQKIVTTQLLEHLTSDEDITPEKLYRLLQSYKLVMNERRQAERPRRAAGASHGTNEPVDGLA